MAKKGSSTSMSKLQTRREQLLAFQENKRKALNSINAGGGEPAAKKQATTPTTKSKCVQPRNASARITRSEITEPSQTAARKPLGHADLNCKSSKNSKSSKISVVKSQSKRTVSTTSTKAKPANSKNGSASSIKSKTKSQVKKKAPEPASSLQEQTDVDTEHDVTHGLPEEADGPEVPDKTKVEIARLASELASAKHKIAEQTTTLEENANLIGGNTIQISMLEHKLKAEKDNAQGLSCEKEALTASLNEQTNIAVNLQASLSSTTATLVDEQQKIAVLEGERNDLHRMVCSLKGNVSALEQRVSILEKEKIEGEAARRHLHNQVQELRGNIRVFCRINPCTEMAAPAGGRPKGLAPRLQYPPKQSAAQNGD